MLIDENQTLKNSLDISKSTVQRLEEQLVMQNSSNLPQPTVQSKVTKKQRSKTQRRTMRDQVTEMQFNMYASTESNYLTENGKPIGHTVRMNMDLKQKLVGKRLKYFIGDDISAEEKAERQQARNKPSEYTLALPHNRFLDCERTCKEGICIASKTNSPTNLYKKNTTVQAEANVELVYYKGKLWLKLLRPVKKGEELFWKYGSSFHINGSINETIDHDLDEESDSDSKEEDVTHAVIVTAAAAPVRSSDRVRGEKISNAVWSVIRK